MTTTTNPKVGSKAPKFKTEDQNGEIKTLEDYKGKWLLLYFYPKDLTPGCTTQACTLEDNISKLKKLNVEVVGVSCDDAKKHQKFIEKHSLSFTLLADTKQELVNKYGVWVEKSMYGKKYMGIQRDSFLINPEGIIAKHYIKVKPEAHAAEVIEDVKKFSKE
ncbi:MAG: thioredoxin-dependent thiol peroxidase [Candidatus Caenarcaniphilales bacterium]|jgi:peroxiredoxin Q/BCP|nr:thioredoxin-dependent thiol peroxidase [Candidatus Caenarcaniphilales bacterium]